jgi:hypothetical protein
MYHIHSIVVGWCIRMQGQREGLDKPQDCFVEDLWTASTCTSTIATQGHGESRGISDELYCTALNSTFLNELCEADQRHC